MTEKYTWIQLFIKSQWSNPSSATNYPLSSLMTKVSYLNLPSRSKSILYIHARSTDSRISFQEAMTGGWIYRPNSSSISRIISLRKYFSTKTRKITHLGIQKNDLRLKEPLIVHNWLGERANATNWKKWLGSSIILWLQHLNLRLRWLVEHTQWLTHMDPYQSLSGWEIYLMNNLIYAHVQNKSHAKRITAQTMSLGRISTAQVMRPWISQWPLTLPH